MDPDNEKVDLMDCTVVKTRTVKLRPNRASLTRAGVYSKEKNTQPVPSFSKEKKSVTVENKGPRLLRGPSLLRGPTNVENIDRLREAQFDMFAKEGNAHTRGPKTTVKRFLPKRKAELHQPAKEGNAQTGEVPVVVEGKAQTRGPKTKLRARSGTP